MMPIQPNEGLPVEAAPAGVNRRALLGRVGAGATMGALAAGGVALGSAPAQAQSITTADVFNFALNLEYLEAEFYLRAVGQTLQARDITGAGFPGDTNGGVSGGRAVQFQSQAIRLYAEKIASDELAHVRLIRSVLGSAAVARPQIDLDTAFTVLARSAGLIGATEQFDAFANDVNFLFGAFIFEDVGVTAYSGAERLLSGDALDAAASILAVEAYHAGAVRTLLANINAGDPVNRIAALRARLSGADDERPLLTPTTGHNFVPTDANGLTYRRTPQQVLRIVYGTANAGVPRGGFFPNGVNGALRVT